MIPHHSLVFMIHSLGKDTCNTAGAKFCGVCKSTMSRDYRAGTQRLLATIFMPTSSKVDFMQFLCEEDDLSVLSSGSAPTMQTMHEVIQNIVSSYLLFHLKQSKKHQNNKRILLHLVRGQK